MTRNGILKMLSIFVTIIIRHEMKTRALIIFAMMLVAVIAMSQPRVQFITPEIVRVRWAPDAEDCDNGTGVCVYEPRSVEVDTVRHGTHVEYISSGLIAEVDMLSGAVTFRDRKSGSVLLREDPSRPHEHSLDVKERIVYDEASARTEVTANGNVTVKDIVRRDTVGVNDVYRVNFLFRDSEGLYGLGSHMEDYMNLLGKTVYLTQHNLKVSVPVINSTGGYGLMFDAGCAMKFSSAPCGADDYSGTMELEAARELDYYFIKGERMDDLVAGYRYLTGAVSLMPRYMFGYIQSRERYTSSDDIINTLMEYRRRHVPIDMIVQDWNYWPEGWGYMKMNRKYYPDPKALADSVHAMNARLMISIWPNPQYCPQQKDFMERGYMLEHSVYDVFNPDAREYYWKYADEEFFSAGFDAWWCDSSEPLDGDWNRPPAPVDGRPYGWDDHERRWHLNKDILSEATGAERSNLYSLYHSMGIYENQRKTTDRKRVVNLTRSGYAGQQRYGTVVWNGDTHASWKSFKQQIPSGLNYMATGNPYWTVDVGSFFTRSDGRWFYKGEFPQGVADDGYKEYYTRMFQWATFLPVLRSHGTDTPREIWRFGEPGTPYYDAILGMIKLRYSLVPYIYSMAAAQSFGDYSMARMLSFDFASDTTTRDIKDQYMFGDLLVCPVTDPGVTSRSVYLPVDPDGRKWIDFWTGTVHSGGRNVVGDAPLHRLPLYVREGTILPMVSPGEYTGEQTCRPVELKIYPGRDASMVLYDDAGDGYDYEHGEYAFIRLSWNDRDRTLEIGERDGRWIGGVSEFVVNVSGRSKKVKYDGRKKTVEMN